MAARKVDEDKDVDVDLDDTKNMKEDPSGYKELWQTKKQAGTFLLCIDHPMIIIANLPIVISQLMRLHVTCACVCALSGDFLIGQIKS